MAFVKNQFTRALVIIFMHALCQPAGARKYFVAPTGGSDTYPGSITQPWATWQKAFNTAKAGDTVYFRGGVWYPTSSYLTDNITYINPDDNVGYNGEPGKPICYFNYPGETPVLDCSKVRPKGNFITGLMMYDLHWIHWRGLTIRNVYQRKQDIEPKGVCGYPISNMIFENMTVHNIGGCGWYLESDVGITGYGLGWDSRGYIPYDTTKFINCDTYQCCDTFRVNPGQTPGNMADGFKFIGVPGGCLYYEGCRAWSCADDGIDLPYGPRKVINNCWSFNHTYPSFNFEGNGIKLSSNSVPPTAGAIVTNCIFANDDIGIYEADYDYRQRARIYNNTIYHCGIGIQLSNNIEYPNSLSIFKNNIIFDCTTLDAAGRPYVMTAQFFYEESNNTFNYKAMGSVPHFEIATDVIVSNNDFVSLDVTELMRPRKPDGSLPDVDFLKLTTGSDLIDAGTLTLPDIDGIRYYTPRKNYGSAPDMGYSEYVTGSIIPPTPTFLFGSVQNATPSNLEMTFSLTLQNVVPATPAFTVKVNASTVDVTNIAISGTKVTLILATPVIFGDVITVAYAKPATNFLRGTEGGEVASFTARTVTNNLVIPTNQPPVISITNPGPVSIFTVPATITLTVEAYDPDGTVSKVEYFNGNTILAQKVTTPWTYVWENVSEGTYFITAVATDNRNTTTSSSSIKIAIKSDTTEYPETEYFKLYPNPNEGHFSIEFINPMQSERTRISIIASDGKVIYNDFILREEILKHFDLSFLKPGSYTLVLTSNEVIFTKKFLIRRL